MIITVALLTGMFCFALFNRKAVDSPDVIFPVMWIAASAPIAVSEDYSLTWYAPLMIVLGAVVFQLSFNIGFRPSGKTVFQDVGGIRVEVVKGIVVVIALSFIVFFSAYLTNILEDGIGNIFSSFRNSSATVREAYPIFKYYVKAVQTVSLCVLSVYWLMDPKGKKKVRIYIVLLIAMGLVCSLSRMTRNEFMFYILPLLFIYISTHRNAKQKNVLIIAMAIVAFLLFFYYVSVGKFEWKYSGGNSGEIIISEFFQYLSGGIIAFDSSHESNAFTGGGAYTFSFILSFIDKVFGSASSVSLVNSFVDLGDFETNVFTFFDYYLRDGGSVYAIIAEAVVGYLHGRVYSKCREGHPLGVLFNSLLMYPLFMQFFQDQYLSLLSTWIQVVIAALLTFWLIKEHNASVYSANSCKSERGSNRRFVSRRIH